MVPLFTAEGLTSVVFMAMIGVTVVGAIIATNTERLIRAVAGLAICFIGVAALYYFLQSPFVAVMEMLIYVGAVCVTIVFAVMLADPEEGQHGKGNILAGPFSIGLGVILFWGLAALALKTEWTPAASVINNGSVVEIGKSLLTTYSMVFELISLVLLVAIIGSLVLARAGRTRTETES